MSFCPYESNYDSSFVDQNSRSNSNVGFGSQIEKAGYRTNSQQKFGSILSSNSKDNSPGLRKEIKKEKKKKNKSKIKDETNTI